MADQRITQLTALTKAGVAATDVLPIADISASETKKVTVQDLVAAGVDLVNAGEIDLSKLDQSSVTKLGTTALADDAVTAAKLAHDSSIAAQTTAPVADNFEGRGYFNTSTGNLQVFNGTSYQQVVVPTAGIGDLQVTTAKLAAGAITTDKVTALGTAAHADSSITTVKLANGAVTAAKLAANTITAAQIAPASISASELANNSVDTASIVNLSVTENKLGAGAVTTAKLGDLAVTDAKIANTTITYGKLNLADGSVPGAKIAADSITSAQIAASAVGTSELADSAVTAAKLGSGAVTSAKLGAGAVTTASVADGSITTAKLGDGAVSYSKLQPTSATNVVLGRSSAGGGTVQEIPLTAAGRALLDDATAADQRATLGLGTLATASGTWVNGSSFSGTSSGTNTGDQTITLTGDVTGSGTGSFAATIATGAVTETKIGTAAVTQGKIADDAVSASKLADQSSTIVQANAPSGVGAFVGQQWLNTNTAVKHTWSGTAWIRQAGIGTISVVDSTPIALAVTYPDAYTATLTTSLDTQAAATVWAGPVSGANAAPVFRALTPTDLPDATATTKGIIQPGTGLSVASGVLNHSNTVTGATVSGITFDAQGHISAAIPLVPADIPVLDASKITSGTLPTDRIADNAISAEKLADYATAKLGETLPIADFIGQIFLNPLDKTFFMWDGNVWVPIGISAGAIVFAGTYNATTNQVASVTTEGSAVGLSVGAALPAATNTNANYYLVVSIGGTGTSPAPTVTLAPPDLLLSNGSSWLEIDVSSTYTAQTASNVAFTPAGLVGSTTVQAAIEEVSSECRNAGNITAGTLAVARGGTGLSSYAKGDIIAASGATTLAALGVGTNGQVLSADSTTATGLKWISAASGTVTTVTSSTAALTIATPTSTPALTIRSATTSVNGIVQLSDSINTTSSTLAATSTAVKAAYDLAAAAMPKSGGVFTADVTLGSNAGLVFEGSTDDANETRLLAVDPTADRLIYLPNADGTLVLSGAIVNADINASAAIADTKLATIATAGKVSNSATTATSANTASAIVARDASGNFTAGTITASLTGAASLNLLKAGDLMTGALGIIGGSVAAPGAYFSGDTNTGLYSPGADQLGLATGGALALLCDSQQRVINGHTTNISSVNASGASISPSYQQHGTTQSQAAISATLYAASASYPSIVLNKSRGATVGAQAVTPNNDVLGYVNFVGSDGAAFQSAAWIEAEVDGTPATGSVPGRLVFGTTAAGGTSPAEGFRLTSDKFLRMAASTGGIQFNGDTAAANALDDYEEGTWTVQLFDAATGGTASSTTTTGYYTKIGDTVSISFSLANTSTAGMTSGNVFYFTLPIATSATRGQSRGTASIDNAGFGSGRTAVVSACGTSASRGFVVAYGSNATDTNLTVGALTSGTSDILVALEYKA